MPLRPGEILNQVVRLTTAMVAVGLSDDQNFPTTYGDRRRDFEITINNAASMTAALKNVEYNEIYRELMKARCYNFKMLDGAFITLRYRFRTGEIHEHSLSYFPSPDLEQFQNDPEIYLLDEVYADVTARNIVPFPLRFEFNRDPNRYVEIDHPYSHLTLGQYSNCRIPVCSPLSPLTFGGFILRNFYNTAFRKYSDDIPTASRLFPSTITANERNIPHLVVGTVR